MRGVTPTRLFVSNEDLTGFLIDLRGPILACPSSSVCDFEAVCSRSVSRRPGLRLAHGNFPWASSAGPIYYQLKALWTS
jgi:hypothetical protein